MTKTSLSDREKELIRLVATGASNKEISQALHISINTVKVHLRNIFYKIEVASRTEAAMWAVQNGLVDNLLSNDRPNTSIVNVVDDGKEGFWLGRFPLKYRFVMIIGVALILVVIGFGVSQLFTPAISTPQPGEILVGPDFEESRWKRLADMPTGRAGLAAAAYDNLIYAIAGEGEKGVLDVNERYDPASDTWEILPPKPIAVADVHAGVVGGRIYIPGGRLDNGEMTDVLEVYDPRTATWTRAASIPAKLSGYALATFEGQIYLFGGYDGENTLDTVYIYGPGQDRWSEGTPMPTARAFAGAAEAGGKIYVIGGWDGEKALDVNEVFLPVLEDVEENPWNESTPMPEGRYGMGVAHTSETVIILCGISDFNKSIASYQFSIPNSNWEKFVNPFESSKWVKMGVNILGNEIYFGGGDVNNSYATNNYVYTAIYTVVLPFIEK